MGSEMCIRDSDHLTLACSRSEREREATEKIVRHTRGSNPKAEGRNKFKPPSALGFGLRISELGLLSAFGLRASDFEST